VFRALLEDRWAKYETVARARLHRKTVQTSEVRSRGDRRRFVGTLLLCGFALGCDKTCWHSCKQETCMHCLSCAKGSFSPWCYSCALRDCSWRLLDALEQLCEEKNWVAEATEELAVRQLRTEVAQICGCSEKKCGHSVTKNSVIHLSIHPSIHPSTHPSIHSFIRSFVRSFLPSFIPSFVRSFVRSFVHAFIH